MDYLKNGDDLIGKAKRKKIVAIKELHGKYDDDPLRYHYRLGHSSLNSNKKIPLHYVVDELSPLM